MGFRRILFMQRQYKIRLSLFCCLALAVVTPVAIGSISSFAHADKLSDKAALKTKLNLQKRSLDQAKSKQKGLKKNVSSLERERFHLNKLLIATARKIKVSENALIKAEGRLGELREQENLVRGSLRRSHEKISVLLGTMQKIGRQPPPVIVTRRDDVLKMVRSAMLLGSVFPELKNQADYLTDKLTTLVRLSTEQAAQRDKLRLEGARLAGNRIRIRSLLAEKRSRLHARKNQLVSMRRQIDQFNRNVGSLSEAIKNSVAIVKQKTALGKYEKELKQTDNGKRTKTGKLLTKKQRVKRKKYAFVNPARLKPKLPFSEARGKLIFPVAGRKIRNFAENDEYGTPSKGIVIETRYSAQIVSPFDGWIVFAGNFRSYGKLLILNVGGGYHIILAGMKKFDVTLGQFVLAGEPIAQMGGAAKVGALQSLSSGPPLYVELRKNGQSINSAPWWAVEKEKV